MLRSCCSGVVVNYENVWAVTSRHPIIIYFALCLLLLSMMPRARVVSGKINERSVQNNRAGGVYFEQLTRVL